MYSYFGMKDTMVAHKLKANARMNEDKDIRIRWDAGFFLLRSLTHECEITNQT